MSDQVHAALRRVVAGGTLERAEAHAAMAEVMAGAAKPAQLAALLVALRLRGETAEELAGFAQAMREHAVPVSAPAGAVDTCGTGGDGAATFNISTAAALLAAAAGVPVAKHGNRAVTSRAGSADVLEALGVPIELGPDEAASALARTGFAFLFAPAYHPAMRHAALVRRELGVPTSFNLLGPLSNPAGVRRQVIGVADPRAARRLALALHALGTDRAFVVHGEAIDELPLDGSGVLYDVSAGGVRRRTVDAAAYGLSRAGRADFAGGSASDNAAIIEAVLDGRDQGPRRDVVLLNAAATLVVAGQASRLGDAVKRAAAALDRGAAVRLLARLRGEEPGTRQVA